jgi:hypothetical protein
MLVYLCDDLLNAAEKNTHALKTAKPPTTLNNLVANSTLWATDQPLTCNFRTTQLPSSSITNESIARQYTSYSCKSDGVKERESGLHLRIFKFPYQK